MRDRGGRRRHRAGVTDCLIRSESGTGGSCRVAADYGAAMRKGTTITIAVLLALILGAAAVQFALRPMP